MLQLYCEFIDDIKEDYCKYFSNTPHDQSVCRSHVTLSLDIIVIYKKFSHKISDIPSISLETPERAGCEKISSEVSSPTC